MIVVKHPFMGSKNKRNIDSFIMCKHFTVKFLFEIIKNNNMKIMLF